MSFKEDLKKALGKLKELETSSRFNSKIGLRTILDSIKKLLNLSDDVDKHLKTLENNFPKE